MTDPLVTVICLCYNQAQFVRESVESVLSQKYQPIQLIVVDDASTDDSQTIIKNLKSTYPQIKLLLLTENIGNCSAFNRALQLAKGDYVIDLAADDLLMPVRIERGVKALMKHGADYAVHFSDAEYIDATGQLLYRHSEKYPHDSIPQGDIYKDLIYRYFICPPSLMVRTDLMMSIGGYDENLYYEDFDFLVRASRIKKFCYAPEVLVKKRIVKNSLSAKQSRFFSKHAQSTFKVCKKILLMNRSADERKALSKRLRYEMLVNVRILNFGLVVRYFVLWIRNALNKK